MRCGTPIAPPVRMPTLRLLLRCGELFPPGRNREDGSLQMFGRLLEHHAALSKHAVKARERTRRDGKTERARGREREGEQEIEMTLRAEASLSRTRSWGKSSVASDMT